jgi:cysteine desulfurase
MLKIYLDHNATTPLLPEVRDAMTRSEQAVFGNPSSIHWAGREARNLLNSDRERIAGLLEIQETELLFTSGGTESINTALHGVWEGRGKKKENGKRETRGEERFEILSSPIEHHATLKGLEFLKNKGAEVTFIKVDRQGRLDLEELNNKISSKTLLVSFMWANNEIGNLYPVQKIGEICRTKGALFHCDAVQAMGKIPISLKKTPVDLLSFSAHKFHGPKGGGGLYVKEGVSLNPLHRGGNQERGLRGGTENILGIHGMALALTAALKSLSEDSTQIDLLRKKLEEGILSSIDGIELNGDRESRLPNTSNLLVEGVDGESLLFNLDLEGIAVSAGAACESGSLDPSHVLLAMGRNPRQAKASIRFSFSKFNTEEEVDRVLEVFPRIVKRLRRQ